MKDFLNRDFARDINRAVQAWVEANAELVVAGSRAVGELSVSINETIRPDESREREEFSDASDEFGTSIYDAVSAIYRVSEAGSGVLKRAMLRF